MSASRSTFDAAGLCQRPLVRRGYCALVVGLAVFLVTLVILREPFHGYLAEVRMEGPAVAGLDLDSARDWLKAADGQVVVVPVATTGNRPQAAIRMTYLAPRAGEATSRLDNLAGRWLAQYLPDRLQAERRARVRETRQIVAAARQREDAARLAVDRLRQQQLADLLDRRAARSAEAEAGGAADPAFREAQASLLRRRMETLYGELAGLLVRCTEQHPEVIRLRMEIAALEAQLRAAAAADAATREAALRPSHFVAATASERLPPVRDWMAELERALAELSVASHDRQSAEHQASDTMQELANLPTAADWSARPAWIVTRIGGTPRTATIALAGLLATVAAGGTFAAARCIAAPRIETAQELAATLGLPVIGSASAKATALAKVRKACTRTRVMAVVRAAEVVVAVAVAACLLAIAVEPALARQVAADPFGTLSEVLGRFGA